MKKIFVIMAAVVCLCSCEKEQKHWLSRTWSGENESTVILLEFTEDRSLCTVQKGVPGDNESLSCDTYYTDVYDDDKSFALREYPNDTELIYMSNITDGKRIIKIFCMFHIKFQSIFNFMIHAPTIKIIKNTQILVNTIFF